MIRQLLEEVKAAPLDEASRNRLKEIHQASIKELEAGLAPELVEELERLTLPFTEDADARRRPSCGSPRPSWSAGSRGSSTGSRPRSTPSRWPPAPSSSRCAARCPSGHGSPRQAGARQPRTTSSRRDPGDSGRDVPLTAQVRPGRRARDGRTTNRPSRPTSTRAAPGAASRRERVGGSASATGVNAALDSGGGGSAGAPVAEQLSRPRATSGCVAGARCRAVSRSAAAPCP